MPLSVVYTNVLPAQAIFEPEITGVVGANTVTVLLPGVKAVQPLTLV